MALWNCLCVLEFIVEATLSLLLQKLLLSSCRGWWWVFLLLLCRIHALLSAAVTTWKINIFLEKKKNLKGILGNGGVKLFWTQNSSPQWWSTLRNCKLSVGVMVNSNSSKSCKKCPIIQMNELASQQRGNWAASAFSEDVQNLPQAAPGFGAKAEHQDSQGRWQRCPFVPSIQSQLLSVQIWEPFPVFSFHLGEVHSKLFPWYRNSEHSLKNSEILQFTLLWQILYFVSSFHGIPSLF